MPWTGWQRAALGVCVCGVDPPLPPESNVNVGMAPRDERLGRGLASLDSTFALESVGSTVGDGRGKVDAPGGVRARCRSSNAIRDIGRSNAR